MSTSRFFEEDQLISQELECSTIPEEMLMREPLLEEKFKCKSSSSGKLETCNLRLFRDVLEISNPTEGNNIYVNLSFVRANYQVLENHSMKYKITLMKFHHELSLFTDKLERVQKWMEVLSKFCINNNFYSKYTVGPQIGAGAFGKVFQVTQNDSKSLLLAAKIFEKRNVKKMFKKLLTTEIQVLQLLDHENIIPIHEVHETGDEVVVVMTLMKEGLLNDFVNSIPKLSPIVIQSIMRQLLSGLAYMASMGVIHRDIKPSNILIESFDKYGNEKVPVIKIADMGLACLHGEKQLFESAGTHGYMAPEVILNDKLSEKEPLTHKLDVYSAGCIFYWLITKRSPFKTNEEVTMVKANESGKIAYDSMYITKFDKQGIELLKRMLEPRPKFRISAKEALKHPYFDHEPDSPGKGMGKTPVLEPRQVSPNKLIRQKQELPKSPIDKLLDVPQFGNSTISRMRSKSYN